MSKKLIPSHIEEMINGLNDPTRSKFLRESHLQLVENSIEALTKAVQEYKTRQVKVARK